MRFYLDEMLPASIAVLARTTGLDVTSSHEQGRDRSSDREQLRFAASAARCIVTRNYDDFARIAADALAQGEPHAGIVLVPPSISDRDPAAFVAALRHFNSLYPDGLAPYAVLWLTPAPGDE